MTYRPGLYGNYIVAYHNQDVKGFVGDFENIFADRIIANRFVGDFLTIYVWFFAGNLLTA